MSEEIRSEASGTSGLSDARSGWTTLLSAQTDLVTVGSARSEDIIAVGCGAVALIARGPAMIGAEILDALETVDVLAATGSGADCFDIGAATARGIPILHNPGTGAEAVSEYVFAAMVTLRRRLAEADRHVRSHSPWEQRAELSGAQLSGSTLGIVGFGHIGRIVARRARAGFGMRVAVSAPGKDLQSFTGHDVEPMPLDRLLRISDVVSLHVPLRADTRGLIGFEQFAAMKPRALLINTARGAVVDQTALRDALRLGQIAGAALDVFEPEPPAADDPLYKLDNVYLSPHIAGLTDESRASLSRAVAENLLMAIGGNRPSHILNPSTWPHGAARPSRSRSGGRCEPFEAMHVVVSRPQENSEPYEDKVSNERDPVRT